MRVITAKKVAGSAGWLQSNSGKPALRSGRKRYREKPRRAKPTALKNCGQPPARSAGQSRMSTAGAASSRSMRLAIPRPSRKAERKTAARPGSEAVKSSAAAKRKLSAYISGTDETVRSVKLRPSSRAAGSAAQTENCEAAARQNTNTPASPASAEKRFRRQAGLPSGSRENSLAEMM